MTNESAKRCHRLLDMGDMKLIFHDGRSTKVDSRRLKMASLDGILHNLIEDIVEVVCTKRGEDNKDRLANGNYIEDTGNHFVYILDKDYNPLETALIAMKSTQKKKSKTWNSMMQSRRLQGSKGVFCPPSWATSYKLTTTKESNSGNNWFGWVVEFSKYLNDPQYSKLLEMTKAFYESAIKSDIFGKVDFGKEELTQTKSNTESVPF